jgi:hypothetical protein
MEIAFVIISNYLQKVKAEHSSRLISAQKKVFIKDIEGCSEHIPKISLLLAGAISKKDRYPSQQLIVKMHWD